MPSGRQPLGLRRLWPRNAALLRALRPWRQLQVPSEAVITVVTVMITEGEQPGAHVVEDVQRDLELAWLQHRVGSELVAQAALLSRLQRQALQLQCSSGVHYITCGFEEHARCGAQLKTAQLCVVPHDLEQRRTQWAAEPQMPVVLNTMA